MCTCQEFSKWSPFEASQPNDFYGRVFFFFELLFGRLLSKQNGSQLAFSDKRETSSA